MKIADKTKEYYFDLESGMEFVNNSDNDYIYSLESFVYNSFNNDDIVINNSN